MNTTKYPLGFAGFVDSATGSIIIDDTMAGRQAPIPTGPLSKTEAAIVELAIIGRQAPIPTGPLAKDNPTLERNLVGLEQKALQERLERLETLIVDLTIDA